MISLQQSAKAFGLALSTRQLEQFEVYWELLSARNQVMNLTAITERDEAIEKHFLDSLALASAADLDGKRLIDVGTGAGFPGLPLKIAIPDLQVTLLDSLQKRVGFLEEVCERLELESVHCVHARAEEWVAEAGEREAYDYAVSRAVAELNMLLELTLPYVNVGGAFLAMKTARAAAEIQAAEGAVAMLGGEIETEHSYTLPDSPEVERRIVVVRKVAPTPERYPRRFARIQKQPLK
ncbi:MAG: 16S rRNA (guanine(527)-N(7))-methyltransferase RsmG [Oscillospiraceae bacterium]|nr:16S rRNA (guanine(527)-N(7))-methyltransferase RsmG [Oscillospiraceae bacterium]